MILDKQLFATGERLRGSPATVDSFAARHLAVWC
jgi:hypothetical protein